MSKIEIYLFDDSNNFIEEISIIKPKTYEELSQQIKLKFKKLPEKYELFVTNKDNEKIEITDEENYKLRR